MTGTLGGHLDQRLEGLYLPLAETHSKVVMRSDVLNLGFMLTERITGPSVARCDAQPRDASRVVSALSCSPVR